MQSALISAPLASTPPQHVPTRPRRSGGSGAVAFRSSDGESGSYPRGGSYIEQASWQRSVPVKASSAPEVSLESTRSIPKSASYIKVEGFDAPGDHPTTSPPQSPVRGAAARAPSLLSRELSTDNMNTLCRPTASLSFSHYAERLEAQVMGESAVKPLPTGPVVPTEPDALLTQLQTEYAVFQEPLVINAYFLARAAHPSPGDGPRGGSAFARCAGSAAILAELKADEVAVACALLHDVMDCNVFTEAQLREHLGNDEAVELVKRVSHIGYICQKYRNASNSTSLSATAANPAAAAEKGQPGTASHLVEMLVAQGPSRALLVRIAVALQETRALETRPVTTRTTSAVANDRAARRQRAAAEALGVWAPLANRLGVWSLKAELEDRAFRVLRPAEYAELRDRLEVVQEPTKLVALVDALRSQLQEVGVEYIDLSGRPKHLWGVWKKMQAKGYSAERVRDVRGLRVIVKSREDCYLALRAVERAWSLVGESKNYIKTPKANGYQSLHAVADPGDGHLVEVQIRTDKMHYLAEYGEDAAHWKYKEQGASTAAPGEDSAAAAAGAAREANWAKFTTSQHVARDKKCRPSGSPSGDLSLASILASMDGAASSEEEGPAAGTSPGSSKGRTFQEYIAFTGQRPAPPEEQRALVAVVAGGAFSVAELPPGTTLGQLLRHCGGENIAPRSLQVVLNRQVSADASRMLQPGDVVELYARPPQPTFPVLSPTPAPATAPAAGAGARPPVPAPAGSRGNLVPTGGLSKKLAAAVEHSS